MFAVIETGGKQYLVSAKDKIRIEKLAGDAGENIAFDKVLLIAGDKGIKLGKPYLANTTVMAQIIKQARARKIQMLKYHSKTRYRRRKGHRQEYTEVEIKSIV